MAKEKSALKMTSAELERVDGRGKGGKPISLKRSTSDGYMVNKGQKERFERTASDNISSRHINKEDVKSATKSIARHNVKGRDNKDRY